jgi:hypothetical protein
VILCASELAANAAIDIICALATDWGINGDHATRTIWATFNWPDHS